MVTPVQQTDGLIEHLLAIVGTEHVRTDAASIGLFSEDIYASGVAQAACVVAPQDSASLAAVVRSATQEGRAIVPRGAGMSYTSGYLPAESGAVVLDLRRMNRILNIDADDMTVTVEAGCAWVDLYEALKDKGLRTPFWGPLSGLSSTIGGGLSQNNAFFGAGTYGPSGDSVLALKIILADGATLDTARAPRGFLRHDGPDLAGLFLGDCGAFGVKAEATLRLIPSPDAEGYASFAFTARDGAIAAISDFARRGAYAEIFAFDPNLQRVRMKRASLAADVKALAGVVRGGKSLLSGVREAARIAVAGRDFVGDDEYSVHLVAEGRSRAGVEADLAAARSVAARHGGREIESTIPKVVRANPFTPLNNILGPDGERWAPVHGIVPHSKAAATWRALDELFAAHADAFTREGVSTGYLATTISTTGFLIEPVFYWPDAVSGIHRATVDASLLAKMTRREANPAARAIVERARAGVIDIFKQAGAAHFQIGRAYPYRNNQTPQARALVDAVKAALDPGHRMNPGVLGLERTAQGKAS